MAPNNLGKMSYTELVKFHEWVETAIAEKRVEASAVKDQLRAAAEKAGFTWQSY